MQLPKVHATVFERSRHPDELLGNAPGENNQQQKRDNHYPLENSLVHEAMLLSDGILATATINEPTPL
jgi:hypothetical protein